MPKWTQKQMDHMDKFYEEQRIDREFREASAEVIEMCRAMQKEEDLEEFDKYIREVRKVDPVKEVKKKAKGWTKKEKLIISIHKLIEECNEQQNK